LFKRINRKDKPVYTHTLGEGETVRIRMFRGETMVDEARVER
jgi:hypothetical protein